MLHKSLSFTFHFQNASLQRREDKSQMICLYFKEDLDETYFERLSTEKVFGSRSGEILIYERTAASKQRDDSKCGRLRNPAYRGGCC